MAKKTPTVLVNWHTATQAARVSGLSVHMVDYLCRLEIVVPSGSVSRSRGRARRYTYGDVVTMRVISKLLAQGVSVLRCKKALLALTRQRKDGSQFLSERYLVTDGCDVLLKTGGVLEAIGSGQMSFAFVLDLAPIRKHVSAKLETRKAG
jgi:DNA-binding transcriptional MerR regulator